MAVGKQVEKRRKAVKRAKQKTGARSAKPKDAKIRKLISDAAAKGVIKLVAEDLSLKKTYLKKLDFTPASLKAFDSLIKRIWSGECPSDEHFDLMVWAFGAYVAEVIQRNNEGFWVKEEGVYQFVNPGGFGVFPWAWVRKRFEEDDLIAPKYDTAMRIGANFF